MEKTSAKDLKVKLFMDDLEKELNTWLNENPKLKIIDIKYQATGLNSRVLFSALVIYNESNNYIPLPIEKI